MAEIIPLHPADPPCDVETDNVIRADWDRIRRQRECADRIEDPFWRFVDQWIGENDGGPDAA